VPHHSVDQGCSKTFGEALLVRLGGGLCLLVKLRSKCGTQTTAEIHLVNASTTTVIQGETKNTKQD